MIDDPAFGAGPTGHKAVLRETRAEELDAQRFSIGLRRVYARPERRSEEIDSLVDELLRRLGVSAR